MDKTLLTTDHPAGTEVRRDTPRLGTMWATYTGRHRTRNGWPQYEVENEHGLFWLCHAEVVG